ncbi:MAG: recombinase RecT [Thermodesulfobacteriota bacterium]|nr:recombinase RecT [Thermodesulfobacteriota bacterium]
MKEEKTETGLTVTQRKAVTIKEWLNKPAIIEQISAALPRFLTPEKFLRSYYTALIRNPKLLDCTNESLLGSMIEMAQLGLEPVLGKAALIPYGNKATFQPEYRGLIDLARRSGKIKITAHVVYENDNFHFCYGLREDLTHIPCESGDRGEPRGAYTVWTYDDGSQTFLYLPISDINEIRDKYSKAYNYAKDNPGNKDAQETPWITRPGEMAKKTVIIQHSKLQPCSIEMEKAVQIINAHDTGDFSNLINHAKDIPPTEIDKITGEIMSDDTLDSGTDYTGQDLTNEEEIPLENTTQASEPETVTPEPEKGGKARAGNEKAPDGPKKGTKKSKNNEPKEEKNGNFIYCHGKEGPVHYSICKICTDKEKCQEYKGWEYEQNPL